MIVDWFTSIFQKKDYDHSLKKPNTQTIYEIVLMNFTT